MFSFLPEGQSERLYGALAVMAQILQVTSPITTWPKNVADLLKNNFLEKSLVMPCALGLPEEGNGVLQTEKGYTTPGCGRATWRFISHQQELGSPVQLALFSSFPAPAAAAPSSRGFRAVRPREWSQA